MKEEIIKQLTQCLVAILSIVTTYLLGIAANYIKKQRELTIKKIGAEQYNKYMDIATSIYYAIEQKYRFTSIEGSEKAEEFNTLLKQYTHLSDKEIDTIRESICGKVNAAVEESKVLEKAPMFNIENDISDPNVWHSVNSNEDINI